MNKTNEAKVQAVQVSVTPASFAQVYSRMGRKPNLVPVSQGSGVELTFMLDGAALPMSVTLRDDGTWTASAVIGL
jgi:hypothetical protein